MSFNAARNSFRQPSRDFARIWFMMGCLGVSFLGIAVIGCRELCLQTDYPKAFSDDRFRQITVGMPVDGVFNIVGYPFSFRVPSLGGRGYFTNTVNVRSFLSNEGETVVLEYSRPRRGDKYQARQIVVASGRVIKVDAYVYWGH
jgi:hypothetical protein